MSSAVVGTQSLLYDARNTLKQISPVSGNVMQPHFSKGTSDSIAFVFSCPGRLEEREGHPAAGTTGRNLELLASLLSYRLEGRVLTRADVTIANAWKAIEYEKLTNRSEATNAEIRHPDNMKRLAAEIQHVTKLIVFCGDKAEIAARELMANNLVAARPEFAFLKHLGTRGLSKIATDVSGVPILKAKAQMRAGQWVSLRRIQAENTRRRLEVLSATLTASVALQGTT